MRIDIITIFPDYFAPLDLSLIGKARTSGLLDVRLHDLRSWTHDRHNTVDDTPYGGGPGMVMKPEPWGEALDAVTGNAPSVPRLILPTPSGAPFTQADASRLAREPWLVFACGRYEGIDSRVAADAAERMPVEEVSIGDYVLNGGESATLVMVEAVSRLLPGVLGNAESVAQDSFAPGAMDNLVEGRSTPSRRSGATARSRRCCCPATTARSTAGGATRRCARPPATAPTCCGG